MKNGELDIVLLYCLFFFWGGGKIVLYNEICLKVLTVGCQNELNPLIKKLPFQHEIINIRGYVSIY